MLVFFVSDRQLQLLYSVASDRELPYLVSVTSNRELHVTFVLFLVHCRGSSGEIS